MFLVHFYYVPGTVLGIGERAWTDENPRPCGADMNKTTNKMNK